MPTAAEQKRLIEGIAYIQSHRDLWEQGMWHSVDRQVERNTCGTVGCLAGHLALTLNPFRPVVKFDKKLFEKPFADRTEADNERVNDIYAFSDFVLATADDDPGTIVPRTVGGKSVPTVHVRYRAGRLIGLSSYESTGDYGLFAGRNDLADIYRHGAKHIGISQAELRRQVNDVIAKRGWDKDAAKRAAKRTAASARG